MTNSNQLAPLTFIEKSVDELSASLSRRPLYAVLDACDEPLIPKKVQELGPEKSVSLYRPPAEFEFWDIAPYLVRVDEEVLKWIVGSLQGTPWGIFAFASVDLPTLRRHFRRFLKVKNEEGKPYYFRFYDPRVLPAFLSSSTEEEARQVFGPVRAYGFLSDDARRVNLCTLGETSP